MTRFHLAQMNIGRIRAPLEDPIMDGFRNQLDTINALAEATPGFVWRLQTDEGNSMAIRPYADDERMAITVSVWESLDAVQQFVYRSAHAASLRDRRQWFEPSDGPSLALWWIPAGQLPTVAEAIDRLQLLKERGPSPEAFTFRKPFPPPHAADAKVTELDAAFCEWAT